MICSMYRAAPGTPGMSATGFEERTYKLALMRINSEEPSFLCLGQHNHVDVGHLWVAAPPWSFICAYFTNSLHASSPQSRADRTARRARTQQERFARRRRRLGHAGSTWPTTRVLSRPTLARISRFLHPPFPSSQSPLSFFTWQFVAWACFVIVAMLASKPYEPIDTCHRRYLALINLISTSNLNFSLFLSLSQFIHSYIHLYISSRANSRLR
jgi:hypothetical protein